MIVSGAEKSIYFINTKYKTDVQWKCLCVVSEMNKNNEIENTVNVEHNITLSKTTEPHIEKCTCVWLHTRNIWQLKFCLPSTSTSTFWSTAYSKNRQRDRKREDEEASINYSGKKWDSWYKSLGKLVKTTTHPECLYDELQNSCIFIHCFSLSSLSLSSCKYWQS